MQINSNFNRMSAPQFGMALKISKGGEKYLEKQSIKFLNRLEQAGQDMVDFKHFDLEVGEQGLSVKHKLYNNAYKNPKLDTNLNPYNFHPLSGRGKEVKVNAMYDGPNPDLYKKNYYIDFDYPTHEAAITAYNRMETADHLERHILLTEMLEDKYSRSAAEKAAEKVNTEEKLKAVSNLLSKFGNNE